MKTCSHCKIVKDVASFSKASAKPDGKQNTCKACQSDFYKKRYKTNKSEYADRNKRAIRDLYRIVDDIKAKSPCTDCGQSYPPWVMDFDHIDASTKTASVSELIGHMSIPKVLREIEKCELVCSNCHRQRTYARTPNKRR